VEWINDSSANIVFADGATAKRAVAGMGTPLSPEEAPEQLGEWRQAAAKGGWRPDGKRDTSPLCCLAVDLGQQASSALVNRAAMCMGPLSH
jgi:hypothetical protein